MILKIRASQIDGEIPHQQQNLHKIIKRMHTLVSKTLTAEGKTHKHYKYRMKKIEIKCIYGVAKPMKTSSF